MFSLSLPEMLVIGTVALLVFGPEKLPGLARDLGTMIRRLNGSMRDLQRDFSRELPPADADLFHGPRNDAGSSADDRDGEAGNP